MLLGESRIVSALKKAAKASPADETLLAAQRGGQTTLRFAGGRIHQNFHEEDVTVWAKVAGDGRMGVATTSSLKPQALSKAIESALAIAQLSLPAQQATGQAGGKRIAPAFSTTQPKEPTPRLTTHFSTTVHRPLAETVGMIRQLQNRLKGMALAGSFVVGEEELAVVGSRGLTQYQPFSIAGLRLVATQAKASGFSAQTVRDLDALEPEALVRRAAGYCRRNIHPQRIPLGKYDVLLEPEAVAELVEWLSYIGFGAKQMVEGTSFMAGRIGERLMHKQLSISDDGSDPEGLAVAFDFEGIPRQPVRLIERGIAGGVVYDSQYARLHHRRSTGHALPYDEFEGPLATNLFLAPGQTPYGDLLRGIKRGLWVTRFHYVNGLLNTPEALMTGLTRDGTFLVRDGKVVGAVKNLRFTQSILEAFSRLLAVSKERRLVADLSSGSSVLAPALLIQGFTFTGQTK